MASGDQPIADDTDNGDQPGPALVSPIPSPERAAEFEDARETADVESTRDMANDPVDMAVDEACTKDNLTVEPAGSTGAAESSPLRLGSPSAAAAVETASALPPDEDAHISDAMDTSPSQVPASEDDLEERIEPERPPTIEPEVAQPEGAAGGEETSVDPFGDRMAPSRLLQPAFLETIRSELPPDPLRSGAGEGVPETGQPYFSVVPPNPADVTKPEAWGPFLPVSFSTFLSLDAKKLEEWNVRSILVADRSVVAGRVLEDRFTELCGYAKKENSERMTEWGSARSLGVWNPRIANIMIDRIKEWKVGFVFDQPRSSTSNPVAQHLSFFKQTPHHGIFLFPGRELHPIIAGCESRLPAPEPTPDCPHWELRLWRVQMVSCLRWIRTRVEMAESRMGVLRRQPGGGPSEPSILVLTPPKKVDNIAAIAAAWELAQPGAPRTLRSFMDLKGFPGFTASQAFLKEYDVEVAAAVRTLKATIALSQNDGEPSALFRAPSDRSVASGPSSRTWKNIPGAPPNLLFVPWDNSAVLPALPAPLGKGKSSEVVATPAPASGASTAPPPAPAAAAAQTMTDVALGHVKTALDGFLAERVSGKPTTDQARLATQLSQALATAVEAAVALRASELAAIEEARAAERRQWEEEREAILAGIAGEDYRRLKMEKEALAAEVETLKKRRPKKDEAASDALPAKLTEIVQNAVRQALQTERAAARDGPSPLPPSPPSAKKTGPAAATTADDVEQPIDVAVSKEDKTPGKRKGRPPTKSALPDEGRLHQLEQLAEVSSEQPPGLEPQGAELAAPNVPAKGGRAKKRKVEDPAVEPQQPPDPTVAAPGPDQSTSETEQASAATPQAAPENKQEPPPLQSPPNPRKKARTAHNGTTTAYPSQAPLKHPLTAAMFSPQAQHHAAGLQRLLETMTPSGRNTLAQQHARLAREAVQHQHRLQQAALLANANRQLSVNNAAATFYGTNLNPVYPGAMNGLNNGVNGFNNNLTGQQVARAASGQMAMRNLQASAPFDGLLTTAQLREVTAQRNAFLSMYPMQSPVGVSTGMSPPQLQSYGTGSSTSSGMSVFRADSGLSGPEGDARMALAPLRADAIVAALGGRQNSQDFQQAQLLQQTQLLQHQQQQQQQQQNLLQQQQAYQQVHTHTPMSLSSATPAAMGGMVGVNPAPEPLDATTQGKMRQQSIFETQPSGDALHQLSDQAIADADFARAAIKSHEQQKLLEEQEQQAAVEQGVDGLQQLAETAEAAAAASAEQQHES